MNPNTEKFTKVTDVAILGASAGGKKFGNSIIKELTKRGIKIYPVHRTADSINGLKVYRTIAELPDQVDTACICMKPENAAGIIDDLIASKLQNLWFQQGTDIAKFIDKLEAAGKNVVIKKCILMYAGEPTGVHAFHRWLNKLFGKY